MQKDRQENPRINLVQNDREVVCPEKGGSNPDPDDFRDLFTDPEFAKIVAAEKEAENAELIANMPNKADRNKNRHPVKVPSEWDRVDHPGENWPKTMHRGDGQIKKDKKKV